VGDAFKHGITNADLRRSRHHGQAGGIGPALGMEV
jgi:hypothetical protein